MSGFENSCVLVSGGSRGLGLALLRHLLAGGARVASFARSSTDEVRALLAGYRERLRFVECDILDYPALERFVDETAAAFGGIDALINNAAIGQDHLLAQTSRELLHQVLAVNLEAPIVLTRKVVRGMLARGVAGRIISISSICGSRGYPGLTAYSAAKGGIDAFTRSLARELGERGILVNAIAPGFFESEMSSVLAAGQIDSIRRRTPSGRLTGIEDILPIVDLLLARDSNINGQTLFTDGGASC